MFEDNWMRLRVTKIVSAVAITIVLSLPSLGQTASIQSAERISDGVLFKTQNGLLKIQVCTLTIIHIVYTLEDHIPDPAIPVVQRSWRTAPFTFKQESPQFTISTGEVQIVIQRDSGRLRLLNSAGESILEEPATGGRSMTPAVSDGRNTWQPEQTFLSPPGEAFYGLGQRQEGFMNWRGIPVRLQQVDGTIGIPVMLSNKGYGVFWNNAALTDFNPTDKRLALDPATKEATFTSAAAGVYGFMAAGGTSRERIALSVNGKSIIDVRGYLVPYAASGKLELKANTEYKLKMEGAAEAPVVYVRPPSDTTGFRSEVGDAIDYYFFYGPDLNKVVAEYRDATGAAPMFPKWAYGFWQCREHYSSQAQLLGAASGFRRRNIPVDAIVQDWQYWGHYGWNAMRFDEQNYPDPGAMIQTLHSENMHFVISVWSKFDPQTEISKQMKTQSLLVPGTDWFDAFNPKSRDLYWSSMRDGLFKLGVDAWWLDATEPEFDPLKNNSTFMGPGNFVRNAYPLYVTQGVYQGQREAAPNQRVAILTRSAYAGQQRNAAASWSGDIAGNWTDFRAQIPGGLNFTMSGIPYWTTDVGGFNRPQDQHESTAYHELLTRWIEYGIFSPLFRIHGNQTETEIWKYGPEVEAAFRKYDGLRYRLFPYIYSTAWMTTHDGYNIMRGLPLDYHSDPKVADIGDEFMFGPSLLVNPVISAGATSRSVYLPQEDGWIDFWTGKTETAGRDITADAPPNKIPLYVKAGSIIPMGPGEQYVAEKHDPIELRVYSGHDASFVLYDDEGTNYNYEKGAYETIPIRWNEKTKTLTIGPRQGKFSGMPKERTFDIVWVKPDHGAGIDSESTPDVEIRFGRRAVEVKETTHDGR